MAGEAQFKGGNRKVASFKFGVYTSYCSRRVGDPDHVPLIRDQGLGIQSSLVCMYLLDRMNKGWLRIFVV